MPIHNWKAVKSGLFHEFHQSWSVHLKDTLNRGGMPKGYFALVEQKLDGPEPDVIAVETKRRSKPEWEGGGLATLAPPKPSVTARIASEAASYARKANRIAIHHPLGDVVAVIEIVSPGNKDSRKAVRSFVDKAVGLLQHGIHLLIIDLFPPSARNPHGIHPLIWNELAQDDYDFSVTKPLACVSYQVDDGYTAHIEPLAVGDSLPDMPLFLTPKAHIPVPLEATYAATWDACPEPIRELLTGE